MVNLVLPAWLSCNRYVPLTYAVSIKYFESLLRNVALVHCIGSDFNFITRVCTIFSIKKFSFLKDKKCWFLWTFYATLELCAMKRLNCEFLNLLIDFSVLHLEQQRSLSFILFSNWAYMIVYSLCTAWSVFFLSSWISLHFLLINTKLIPLLLNTSYVERKNFL